MQNIYSVQHGDVIPTPGRGGGGSHGGDTEEIDQRLMIEDDELVGVSPKHLYRRDVIY
jgi:hypothetical protein